MKQGLNNYLHACVRVHTVYAKAFQRTPKNVHANFEIPLISKIFAIYFTGMFYSYFIEISFVADF